MNENSKRTKHPPDRDRVQLDVESELRYWCNELRCTEGQLRDAVARMGSQAIRVRAYLGRGG
jgi:hypothetical protein